MIYKEESKFAHLQVQGSYFLRLMVNYLIVVPNMFLITKHLGLELLLMCKSNQGFSDNFVLKRKKLENFVNQGLQFAVNNHLFHVNTLLFMKITM